MPNSNFFSYIPSASSQIIEVPDPYQPFYPIIDHINTQIQTFRVFLYHLHPHPLRPSSIPHSTITKMYFLSRRHPVDIFTHDQDNIKNTPHSSLILDWLPNVPPLKKAWNNIIHQVFTMAEQSYFFHLIHSSWIKPKLIGEVLSFIHQYIVYHLSKNRKHKSSKHPTKSTPFHISILLPTKTSEMKPKSPSSTTSTIPTKPHVGRILCCTLWVSPI